MDWIEGERGDICEIFRWHKAGWSSYNNRWQRQNAWFHHIWRLNPSNRMKLNWKKWQSSAFVLLKRISWGSIRGRQMFFTQFVKKSPKTCGGCGHDLVNHKLNLCQLCTKGLRFWVYEQKQNGPWEVMLSFVWQTFFPLWLFPPSTSPLYQKANLQVSDSLRTSTYQENGKFPHRDFLHTEKMYSNDRLAVVRHHWTDSREPLEESFHSFLCSQALARCLRQSGCLVSVNKWMDRWMRSVQQSINVKELREHV